MNWTPAAQIIQFGCFGAFFSERLWLVLRIRTSYHQNLHGQLTNTQVLASCIETRILPPKPKVLKYPANHIRVLDQADDPHLRTALWAGQGIDLPDLFDKLPPGSGWYPPRLVIRYVQTVKFTLSSFPGNLSSGLGILSLHRCPMDLLEYQP